MPLFPKTAVVGNLSEVDNDHLIKNVEEKFKDKKIRRPYIKQNSEFISVVDNHVNNIVSKNIKPSNAYDNFKNTEPYSTSYKSEVLRISEYLDNETEIENKIKKTYKNRYFVKQKNLN